LLLGILFGTVAAFFQPAYAALVSDLVPEEDRSSANSLMQLGGRAAGIGAPVVAAVLITQGGTALALTVDAITYATSALAAMVIMREGRADGNLRDANRSGDAGRPGSLLADLKAGFRAVLGIRWIGLTILIAGITNITLAGPIEAVTPQLVVRHLGGDVATYALINTTTSIGAVVWSCPALVDG
jgi:DHA3 family tetracycline resistance protein-like MFS transporter